MPNDDENWVLSNLGECAVKFNTQLNFASLMFLIAMARRLQAYHYTPLYVSLIS